MPQPRLRPRSPEAAAPSRSRRQTPRAAPARQETRDDVRLLTIDHVDFDGAGVAVLGDASVVIDGALPGERIEAKWLSTSGRRHRARILGILEPSPARVTPFCRHAAECGGCTWQHVAYAEQLRLKRQLVERALQAELGAGAPRVEAVLPSHGGDGHDPPRGFRGKVHFVAQERSDGRIALGHYRRRSHDVVEVQECAVHDPAGNDAAFWIRDALGAAAPPSADGLSRRPAGGLRHLVLRVARHGGEKLATLVVSQPHHAAEAALRRGVQEGVVNGACINLNERPGPYLFGTESRHVGGSERVLERVGDVTFAISPTSFFQTNISAAELLVDLVVGSLPRGTRRVLDLYAGSGLFALPLAAAGCEVVAVEESAAAIGDGRVSLDLNGLSVERCRFVRARVERFLFRHRRALAAGNSYDAVVLDPPRDGCPPRLLATLLQTAAPRTVTYVSCEPRALSRDLASALSSPAGRAYRVSRVQPVDMFPHTAHVETVAVLSRASGGRRVSGGARS